MIYQKYLSSGLSATVVLLLTVNLTHSVVPHNNDQRRVFDGSSSRSSTNPGKAGTFKVFVNGEQIQLQVISESGSILGDRLEEYDDFGRPLPSSKDALCSSLSNPMCESMSVPLDRTRRKKRAKKEITSGKSSSSSDSESDTLSSLLSSLFDSGSSNSNSGSSLKSKNKRTMESLDPDSLEYRLLQQNLKIPLPGGEKVFHFAEQAPMFEELRHPYMSDYPTHSDESSSSSESSNDQMNDDSSTSKNKNGISQSISNSVRESDSSVYDRLARMAGDPSHSVRVRSVTSDKNSRGSFKSLSVGKSIVPIAKQNSDYSKKSQSKQDSSSSSISDGAESEILNFIQEQFGLDRDKLIVSTKTINLNDFTSSKDTKSDQSGKNKNDNMGNDWDSIVGANKMSPNLLSRQNPFNSNKDERGDGELKVVVAKADLSGDKNDREPLNEKEAEDLRLQVNDLLKELLSSQTTKDQSGSPAGENESSDKKTNDQTISELTDEVMNVLTDPSMFDTDTKVSSTNKRSDSKDSQASSKTGEESSENEYELDIEFELSVDNEEDSSKDDDDYDSKELYEDYDEDGDESQDDGVPSEWL